MRNKKVPLRVPPANPELGDEYEREDKQVFVWTGNKEGWRKI